MNVYSKLTNILTNVEKPARYIGGEVGSIMKKADEVSVRFAFCFPDVYEIGMSHLGMRILYHVLNDRDDVWCERVFAPWVDMEEMMREQGVLLYGLESFDTISDFDILGFTLQYEMSYTNILNMLSLAGLPLFSKDRGEDMPFVCVGGPCAYNVEPLADFIDFAIIGEGEEVTLEVIDAYKEWKKSGQNRTSFLEKIAQIEGVYVPSFYDVEYNTDGTIFSFTPNNKNAKVQINKRIIKDFDKVKFPEKIIVPLTDIVHDRITLEVMRGCIRGCRFCQAGYLYRPCRPKKAKTLVETAKKLIKNTGYEEISLSSLSTSDYCELGELTDDLIAVTEKNNISLSLPSLRIDNFSLELMQKVQKVRKSGLTFAPEAGTQRLRDVINKNVTEEDIRNASKVVFGGGYTSVKFYFMIGLPTETMEDVKGIADTAYIALDEYFAIDKLDRKGKSINITLSTSSFVPKAFTPFQWVAQDTIASLKEKQRCIKDNISKRIKYNYHDSYTSVLEGVFARGDRRLSSVIYKAFELGCKFDGWGEHFSYEKWCEAFDKCGVDMSFYNTRKREFDEILPWDYINIGVSKEFLIDECKRAYGEVTTPNCRESCSACGISELLGGACNV